MARGLGNRCRHCEQRLALFSEINFVGPSEARARLAAVLVRVNWTEPQGSHGKFSAFGFRFSFWAVINSFASSVM